MVCAGLPDSVPPLLFPMRPLLSRRRPDSAATVPTLPLRHHPRSPALTATAVATSTYFKFTMCASHLRLGKAACLWVGPGGPGPARGQSNVLCHLNDLPFFRVHQSYQSCFLSVHTFIPVNSSPHTEMIVAHNSLCIALSSWTSQIHDRFRSPVTCRVSAALRLRPKFLNESGRRLVVHSAMAGGGVRCDGLTKNPWTGAYLSLGKHIIFFWGRAHPLTFLSLSLCELLWLQPVLVHPELQREARMGLPESSLPPRLLFCSRWRDLS
ncbi:hypothetical protein BGW80DRAFT_49915 [Lactifluus volemus]|nr:hypothetical protein BGW80DRAFT_49915 [Lactifluus volemus]